MSLRPGARPVHGKSGPRLAHALEIGMKRKEADAEADAESGAEAGAETGAETAPALPLDVFNFDSVKMHDIFKSKAAPLPEPDADTVVIGRQAAADVLRVTSEVVEQVKGIFDIIIETILTH